MAEPSIIEDVERQRLLEQAHQNGAGAGEAANWEMRLGTHRLLLVPTTGVWLFHNPVNDSWDSTGMKAGEVLFRVVDGKLGYKNA